MDHDENMRRMAAHIQEGVLRSVGLTPTQMRSMALDRARQCVEAVHGVPCIAQFDLSNPRTVFVRQAFDYDAIAEWIAWHDEGLG